MAMIITMVNYHEERVRGLHETFELVLPLLELSRGIQQIDVVLENLKKTKRINQIETKR